MHLTGKTIHEWLAVPFSAAIITHLLLHWKWIVKVGSEFFKKLFHQSRLNFVVNTLFFITMTGSFVSGLMISQSVLSTLGIQLDVSRSWRGIHSFMSNASLAMLALHVALHWKWVVINIGRYVADPIRNLFPHPVARPNVMAIQSVHINNDK